MYKALKDFYVPGEPQFIAGNSYHIEESFGKILEARGLVTKILKKTKAKKAVEEVEVEVEEKSNLQKSSNSNLT